MKINSYSRPIIPDYSKTPANLPIAEKMKAQENGLEKGIDNSKDAVNLLNTAEGTLDNVADSLNRIKELAVQAGNSFLTDDDKNIIQNEIQEIKAGISENLKNTEFNNIKLFNGYEGNVQTGPNSEQGQIMNIQNTSLENLGIEDFDVTKDFNIEDLNGAIEKVNSTRSEIGSQINSLDSRIKANSIARENVLSSRTQLDSDFEEKIMELKKNNIINQYKLQTQKIEMDNENRGNRIFDSML